MRPVPEASPASAAQSDPAVSDATDAASNARDASNVPAETDAAAGSSPPEPATAPPALLRAAYILIFLLSLLASYTVWPQAGGQGHLDLMPWYWKLFPPFVFSFAVARASIAALERPKPWNGKTIAWLLVVGLIAALIGGLTYYYHLQESLDQVDSEDGIMTSVQVLRNQIHA